VKPQEKEITDLLERILQEVVPTILSVDWRTRNLAAGLGARQSDDVSADGLRILRIEDWSPGNEVDDIASAETGWRHLITTQFRGQQKLDVRIFLDTSFAMEFTTTDMTKKELAARLAAGVLAAACCKQDNAGCVVYDDSAVRRSLPLAPARQELLAEALWLYLSTGRQKQDKSSFGSGLCQALIDLPAARRNLVFIISDFGSLGAGEIEALKAASEVHAICCLALSDRREENLPESGNGILVLKDMRTGDQRIAWLSEAGRAAWREEYRRAKEALSTLLQSAGCTVWWFSTGHNPAVELAKRLAGEEV
jgi:uncharacterized protein (DUF58 family)